jgi:ParB family chromosome partitioning protein
VQERLTVGHAKVLLSAKNPEEQLALAEETLRRGLTVRGAERLVADHFAGNGSRKPKRGAASSPQIDPAVAHVQNRLRQHLGTQVAMHHGEKKGRIEIEYYGNDDLTRLLKLIGLPDEE